LFKKKLKGYNYCRANCLDKCWGEYNDAKRLAPEIMDERIFHFWDPKMSL